MRPRARLPHGAARRFPTTCLDTALMAVPNAGSERFCAVPGTDSGDQDPRAGTFLADTSAARQSARRRRHTIATSRPGRVRCPRFLTRSVRTATPPHLSFDYRLKTSAPLRCRAGRATSTPAGDGRPGPLKPRAPSRCESIYGTSQSALWACIYILTSTSSLSLRDVGPPRARARKSFIMDDTRWNGESTTRPGDCYDGRGRDAFAPFARARRQPRRLRPASGSGSRRLLSTSST